MNLDQFEAKTGVELALYNEIKKLKLQLHIMEMEKGIYPHAISEKEMVVAQVMDAPYLKLIPSAEVRGSIDVLGKIQVRSEVHFKDNPKCFGQIYYTESIYKDKFEAIHSLSFLHRRFIEDLAHQLKDLNANPKKNPL